MVEKTRGKEELYKELQRQIKREREGKKKENIRWPFPIIDLNITNRAINEINEIIDSFPSYCYPIKEDHIGINKQSSKRLKLEMRLDNELKHMASLLKEYEGSYSKDYLKAPLVDTLTSIFQLMEKIYDLDKKREELIINIFEAMIKIGYKELKLRLIYFINNNIKATRYLNIFEKLILELSQDDDQQVREKANKVLRKLRGKNN